MSIYPYIPTTYCTMYIPVHNYSTDIGNFNNYTNIDGSFFKNCSTRQTRNGGPSMPQNRFFSKQMVNVYLLKFKYYTFD